MKKSIIFRHALIFMQSRISGMRHCGGSYFKNGLQAFTSSSKGSVAVLALRSQPFPTLPRQTGSAGL